MGSKCSVVVESFGSGARCSLLKKPLQDPNSFGSSCLTKLPSTFQSETKRHIISNIVLNLHRCLTHLYRKCVTNTLVDSCWVCGADLTGTSSTSTLVVSKKQPRAIGICLGDSDFPSRVWDHCKCCKSNQCGGCRRAET